MRVRHSTFGLGILRRPLLRTGWTRRQLPFVIEQVLQKAIVPLDGIVGPSTLKTTGDGVRPFAAFEFILPAQTLFFNRSTFGFRTNVLWCRGRAMHFAERMAADDE